MHRGQLSRQIASLERELGVELFHPERDNVALTAAGERLLPIAKRMLADADTARGGMAELAGLRRGRVRLGATPTLCTSLVVDVLAEFRDRYPGIDIEILERGSRSLISALAEGALDLALIVTSVSSEGARAVLEREPILSERLVVVSAAELPDPFARSGANCGAGTETAAGPPISLEQLGAVPQVSFPENYDLRVAMDAAFGAAGITPAVAVEGAETVSYTHLDVYKRQTRQHAGTQARTAVRRPAPARGAGACTGAPAAGVPAR